ncbi:putative neural-cadherin 2 [Chionoecetes opilio]|uniref:Putative neural-cadherin 2 n=1 Tax=Chionoecetes opilio TaxID=41210 RepID=A0A8J4Y9Q7_CHIOP|nr:putative neural-cadherin 2 [Chionoecetes opilio]
MYYLYVVSLGPLQLSHILGVGLVEVGVGACGGEDDGSPPHHELCRKVSRRSGYTVADADSTAVVGPTMKFGCGCECGRGRGCGWCAKGSAASSSHTCTPHSCLNGGRCYPTSDGVRCACPQPTAGLTCKVLTRHFQGHTSTWAWVAAVPPCPEVHISLEVLTASHNATLLYSGPDHLGNTASKPSGSSSREVLVLELRNGRPFLMLDLGGGPVTLALTASYSLADSIWHRLDVIWKDELVEMVVDLCSGGTMDTFPSAKVTEDPTSRPPPPVPPDAHTCRGAARLPSTARTLNHQRPLQVGGMAHPAPSHTTHRWPQPVTSHPLKGCVRNLRVNGELRDLGAGVLSSGSSPGCPAAQCPAGSLNCGLHGSPCLNPPPQPLSITLCLNPPFSPLLNTPSSPPTGNPITQLLPSRGASPGQARPGSLGPAFPRSLSQARPAGVCAQPSRGPQPGQARPGSLCPAFPRSLSRSPGARPGPAPRHQAGPSGPGLPPQPQETPLSLPPRLQQSQGEETCPFNPATPREGTPPPPRAHPATTHPAPQRPPHRATPPPWLAPSLFLNPASITNTFRTRKTDGDLVMLSSEGRGDNFGVQLVRGRACVLLQLHPDPPRTLCLARVQLTDGRWHSLHAARYGSATFLTADEGDGDLYNASVSLEGRQLLEVDREAGVVLGGAPHQGEDRGDRRTSASQRDFHEGCLEDVRICGRPVPLPPAMNRTAWGRVDKARGVGRGCDAPPACGNVTCRSPLTCVDTWRSYHCGCFSGYGGVHCQLQGPAAASLRLSLAGLLAVLVWCTLLLLLVCAVLLHQHHRRSALRRGTGDGKECTTPAEPKDQASPSHSDGDPPYLVELRLLSPPRASRQSSRSTNPNIADVDVLQVDAASVTSSVEERNQNHQQETSAQDPPLPTPAATEEGPGAKTKQGAERGGCDDLRNYAYEGGGSSSGSLSSLAGKTAMSAPDALQRSAGRVGDEKVSGVTRPPAAATLLPPHPQRQVPSSSYTKTNAD